MSSAALDGWRTVRSSRLDELVLVHQEVRGGPQRRGRPWRTQQVNNAMMLRLATEFQGFSRELHDLAADVFAERAAPTNPALRTTIRARLTEGRQLDRGNAQPASLGSDFGRFGLSLWPAMTAMAPAAGGQVELERLNSLRNALVHDDTGTLAQLSAAGNPSTLARFREARRALNGLAGTLDAVVADHLGRLFAQPNPW